MARQTVTVAMTSLSEPPREFKLAMDAAYTVLDLIVDLKSHDSVLGMYSLRLPQSGLISPAQLGDTVQPQLRGDVLDLKVYNPITYRNSFNVIQHLIGLHAHKLLETTNLMDVEPINHAKLGEWIGFGRGPTTVPPEEDNRLPNLMWVIHGRDKPVCYNVHGLHALYRNGRGGQLLIPHLNQKIHPAKFLVAYEKSPKDSFRILCIDENDIVRG